MKANNIIYIFILWSIFVIVGCKPPEESKGKFKRINAYKTEIRSNLLLSEVFENYQIIPLKCNNPLSITSINKLVTVNNGFLAIANEGKQVIFFNKDGNLFNLISSTEENINDIFVNERDSTLHILYNSFSIKYQINHLTELKRTKVNPSTYKCYAGLDTIALFNPGDQRNRLIVYHKDSVIFKGFPANLGLGEYPFYGRNPFQVLSSTFYMIDAFDNKIYSFVNGQLKAQFEILLQNVIANDQIPKVPKKQFIPYLISKEYSFSISCFLKNEETIYFNYRRKEDLIHYLRTKTSFHFDSYIDDIGGLYFSFIPLFIDKDYLYIGLSKEDIKFGDLLKTNTKQKLGDLENKNTINKNMDEVKYLLLKMKFKS